MNKWFAVVKFKNILITIGVVAAIALFGMYYRNYSIKSEIRNARQADRSFLLRKYRSFIWKSLCVGMSREEVAAITGHPQNTDNQFVWIWIDDFEKFDSSFDKKHWEEMYNYSDGYFVLFDKDKRLLSNIYANSAASPVEILAGQNSVSLHDAEVILKN